MKLLHAFCSPILQFEDGGFPLHAIATIKACNQLQMRSKGVQVSNHNGWHSEPDLFSQRDPALQRVAAFIQQCVAEACGYYAGKASMAGATITSTGWVNILPPGGMNKPHDHIDPRFVWSGTYYVKVPTGAGAIEFIDNRPIVSSHAFPGPLFMRKFRVEPQAGTLVMFPSTLLHWVYPNQSDQSRISIAFNAGVVLKAQQTELQ